MLRIKRLSKINLYFQVFFWVFFGVLGFVFSYSYEGTESEISIWVFLVNWVLHIAMVNFHLLYLVPAYFSKRKYLTYACLTFLLLMGVSLIKSGLFILTYTPPKMGKMEVFGTLPSLAFVVTILVFIVTLPFLFIESLIEKETLKERMRAEQLESELRILRSQINPHFLFNTLNNIYALIETGNQEAGRVVLQLSDLMHHLISVATEDMVKVEEEVRCLEAYIDLYRLQQNGEPQVSISMEIRNKEMAVPALLLITLLENAFKHGNWNDEQGVGYIQGQLKTDANGLHFRLVNSLSDKVKNTQRKRIGLDNITHRMKLLFPDQHRFNAYQKGEEFITELEIFLKPALAKTA